MSKHTPGPWKAEGWRETVVNAPSGYTLALAPSGRAGAPLEEIRANAALIAAAPELLQACRDALQDLTTDGARHFMSRYYTQRAWQARVESLAAAIAKATGPTQPAHHSTNEAGASLGKNSA